MYVINIYILSCIFHIKIKEKKMSEKKVEIEHEKEKI
jgi:hypothetical protein